MRSNTFSALTTALLLSAGIAAFGSLPAAAASVRPAVGAALNAAIRDAEAGNGSAANEKIREAESVGGLSSGEQQAIEQTRNFVAAKTGVGGGAIGAKTKFANDYNAGRYSAVVGEDAEALRRAGAMDGQSELIVAQAYYLMHDYDSCVRQVRGMGRGSQTAAELMMRCAYETHDEAVMQTAMEQLVVDFNQPKYWKDLLDSADRTQSMSDLDTLNVYRLRLLTNTMVAPGSYATATEIAIQFHFDAEAAMIAQKGLDAHLIDTTQGTKLLNLAKSNMGADAANLTRQAAAAAQAKNGDAYLKLSEAYWSLGRYQDALTAAKAAIAKGPTNPDVAQIDLGMAYIGLHQREAAVHALAAVSRTAPQHTLTVARIWSIYARTH
jgi:tetratricopeptide (TPR) repeat protein